MLFTYYGGHGCAGFGPHQNVVLNEGSKSACYPLEEVMRNLAQMNCLTAVFAIYDTSRVPVTPGLNLGPKIDEEREVFQKVLAEYGDAMANQNYICMKACQPAFQVPLESKLSESFWKYIQ